MADSTAVPELTLAQHRVRAWAAVDEALAAVRLAGTSSGIGKIPQVSALYRVESRAASIGRHRPARQRGPHDPGPARGEQHKPSS